MNDKVAAAAYLIYSYLKSRAALREPRGLQVADRVQFRKRREKVDESYLVCSGLSMSGISSEQ